MAEKVDNPVGLDGFEFVEYTGPQAQLFTELFQQFGFTPVAQHKSRDITLFRQNDVNFLLNNEKGGFAEQFHKAHGPSICSTGFRVRDAQKAFASAVERGARPYKGDTKSKVFGDMPAVYGIGDSLIYFVDQYGSKGNIYDGEFNYTSENHKPSGFGLKILDHLTNNVPKGEMQKWCDFYSKIFNFQEKRYFDIRGKQTGLFSKVMRSPCAKIMIPINEPTGEKSQIQEYLDEYHGSGIQHLAMQTDDILASMRKLHQSGIGFLDTPESYYKMISDRVPGVTEDIRQLQDLKLLVDGDDEGYLLQIFTKNVIGPIFFEIIQRKNHEGFGEGNFQALFDAIERDQRARGYL